MAEFLPATDPAIWFTYSDELLNRVARACSRHARTWDEMPPDELLDAHTALLSFYDACPGGDSDEQ